MTFQYSEVSRWGLGGSFLVSSMTCLVIQWSQKHFLGHLGGPDLVFIDFGCVLGSPWESLSTPFRPPSFIPRISNQEVLRRADYPEATAPLVQSQLQILRKVLRAPATSQLHSCAFSPGTLQPATSRYVRRVGRPRKEWIPIVMAEAARRSSPHDLHTLAQILRQWKMAMSSR